MIINFFKNLFSRFKKQKIEIVDKVTIDPKVYEKLTKNDLVRELWSRNIDHNKRMVKQQLIDLLVEDDKKKFK